jgi:hypothetical protein
VEHQVKLVEWQLALELQLSYRLDFEQQLMVELQLLELVVDQQL